MRDTARITLNFKEAVEIKVALRAEMDRIDRLVEIVGDPNGTQAKDRAVVESLYHRTEAAIKRMFA